MATELKKKLDYPLTIMYLQLKWCGFAFKYLSKHLGNEQYCPENAEPIPENRLFARYHSPQTIAMKHQILSELSSPSSKLRLILATVALGMGIDIPGIKTCNSCWASIPSQSIFRRQDELVVMANRQQLFCITTTMTLLYFDKGLVTMFVSTANLWISVLETFFFVVWIFITMS